MHFIDQAQIYVRLVPKADRNVSQDELGAVFRRELKQVGGAETSVFTSGFGGAMKQIQVEMRGPDPTVLTRLAMQAAAEVRKVPGASGKADCAASTTSRPKTNRVIPPTSAPTP